MIGRSENVTSTNLLEIDLESYSFENIKKSENCSLTGILFLLRRHQDMASIFYNVKSAKYDTVVKAGIMEGEYGVPTYTVGYIFQRFGYDYENWDKNLYAMKIINKNEYIIKRTVFLKGRLFFCSAFPSSLSYI